MPEKKILYGRVVKVSGPRELLFPNFSLFLLLSSEHSHLFVVVFPVVVADKMSGSSMYELVSLSLLKMFTLAYVHFIVRARATMCITLQIQNLRIHWLCYRSWLKGTTDTCT